jgi:hypothetical protein
MAYPWRATPVSAVTRVKLWEDQTVRSIRRIHKIVVDTLARRKPGAAERGQQPLAQSRAVRRLFEIENRNVMFS